MSCEMILEDSVPCVAVAEEETPDVPAVETKKLSYRDIYRLREQAVKDEVKAFHEQKDLLANILVGMALEAIDKAFPSNKATLNRYFSANSSASHYQPFEATSWNEAFLEAAKQVSSRLTAEANGQPVQSVFEGWYNYLHDAKNIKVVRKVKSSVKTSVSSSSGKGLECDPTAVSKAMHDFVQPLYVQGIATRMRDKLREAHDDDCVAFEFSSLTNGVILDVYYTLPDPVLAAFAAKPSPSLAGDSHDACDSSRAGSSSTSLLRSVFGFSKSSAL